MCGGSSQVPTHHKTPRIERGRERSAFSKGRARGREDYRPQRPLNDATKMTYISQRGGRRRRVTLPTGHIKREFASGSVLLGSQSPKRLLLGSRSPKRLLGCRSPTPTVAFDIVLFAITTLDRSV